MKKIFRILLSVVLMGAFTACNIEEFNESADIGLGIKVFFPTKVVTGQPMTINGSGFLDAKEIVFPNGVSVTNFEVVSNDMIRVIAPSGIFSEGGKIKVVTSEDAVESKEDLTLGRTVVSGYSKQEGESAQGGEQITIFGEDLEFINAIEVLDVDGNPYLISDADFYRKGTSTVIFTVPRDNIFTGSFVGRVFTYDGREFALPELAYEPAPTEGGHWETVKKILWKNDGTPIPAWGGTFRFSNVETSTGEEIYAFPMEDWAIIKDGTFRVAVDVNESSNIRVTTGWWSAAYGGAEHNCIDFIQEEEDGTKYIELNIKEEGSLYDAIDVQHLLLTGDAYTILYIYTSEEVWIEGGGHMETVKTTVWKGDGSAGAVSWNGTYRFALEGHDGSNECIAEIPQDLWEKMKTTTFYVDLKADDPQVRITTGWWDANLYADDIQPGNDLITDNGDGTWTVKVNLADNPDLVASMDEKHLLFTGGRYTPVEIYFAEEVWVEGGDGGSSSKPVVFWENSGAGAVSWNGTYRFALEGHDGNNECIAELPQDVWDKIKTQTFYLDVQAEDPQVRVTTGWWDPNWRADDIQPGSDLITDNGDGTWTVTINAYDNPDFIAALDDRHILFTGARFTPIKLYFK